jgi:hypothetical protein
MKLIRQPSRTQSPGLLTACPDTHVGGSAVLIGIRDTGWPLRRQPRQEPPPDYTPIGRGLTTLVTIKPAIAQLCQVPPSRQFCFSEPKPSYFSPGCLGWPFYCVIPPASDTHLTATGHVTLALDTCQAGCERWLRPPDSSRLCTCAGSMASSNGNCPVNELEIAPEPPRVLPSQKYVRAMRWGQFLSRYLACT